MIPKVFREVIDLGDGREISIETGKLAKQAHGSRCCYNQENVCYYVQ